MENPDGVVFLCSISYKRKIPTGYCKYQLANNKKQNSSHLSRS